MKIFHKSVTQTDMTTGSPTKHILMFALPLYIGNLFQQFYNMVDSLVVGKYVGSNALAAIGTCASLNFLFFSLSAGLSNGIGVIVSQYYGAKDEDNVRNTIANSFYVLISASVLTTLMGIFLAKPILILMQTPAEILPDSVTYLRTTCCGILFIALYNGVAASLRALGDSRTPLYFLIMSSFVNIGLDLLFVLKFDMGVFGVGLATIIAQLFSAIVSLTYAFIKVPYYRLSKQQLRPHKKIILNSFKIGVPISLQNSMIAISMIILQGVVNSFGAVTMATNTICSRVDLVVSQLYSTMNMTMNTYAGQNIGAGKIDRVKAGYKRGTLMITAYNLVVVPIVFLLSRQICSIFVNEAEVINMGATAMRITCVCYFALGLIYVPRGIMNGCGDAAFSMINGVAEVICRILYAAVLTRIAFIGVWGIWAATGLTWISIAIICQIRYFGGKWKRTAITQAKG